MPLHLPNGETMMTLRESREEKGRSQGSVFLKVNVHMSLEDLIQRFKSRVEPKSLHLPTSLQFVDSAH